MRIRTDVSLSRRNLLKSGLLGGVPLLSAHSQAQDKVQRQTTIRDRFWLYGQEANALYGKYNLPGESYITAAEAACYLSIPNLLFGFCHRTFPGLSVYRQLAIPFRPLARVLWSIVGCSGRTDSNDRDAVMQLASETPNITGIIMDDFFRKGGTAALTVEELRDVRRKLKDGIKKLDIWVVLYDRQVESAVVKEYLPLCDGITFWSLSTLQDLRQMPSSLAKLEKVAPETRKMIGCYMYNFGEGKPMPVSVMKEQCELDLEWIKQGRVEGMIFDESNICDYGFDAVEWSREWIRKVGDQKLVVKR
jgi:hypothetical protein